MCYYYYDLNSYPKSSDDTNRYPDLLYNLLCVWNFAEDIFGLLFFVNLKYMKTEKEKGWCNE